MPIYKDTNGETQIAHFGIGDIAITKGRNRDKSYEDEILLIQVPEAHEVNETFTPEFWEQYAGKTSEEVPVPIRLIFERPESIDALISELQELRAIIVDNQAKPTPPTL